MPWLHRQSSAPRRAGSAPSRTRRKPPREPPDAAVGERQPIHVVARARTRWTSPSGLHDGEVSSRWSVRVSGLRTSRAGRRAQRQQVQVRARPVRGATRRRAPCRPDASTGDASFQSTPSVTNSPRACRPSTRPMRPPMVNATCRPFGDSAGSPTGSVMRRQLEVGAARQAPQVQRVPPVAVAHEDEGAREVARAAARPGIRPPAQTPATATLIAVFLKGEEYMRRRNGKRSGSRNRRCGRRSCGPAGCRRSPSACPPP